jgi:hypothetical protein
VRHSCLRYVRGQARGNSERNMAVFLRWGFISISINLQLEDHPLSAVRDCLFDLFAATLHTGGAPPSSTWGNAMSWWQGPTYHGDAAVLLKITCVRTSHQFSTPYAEHTAHTGLKNQTNICNLSFFFWVQPVSLFERIRYISRIYYWCFTHS